MGNGVIAFLVAVGAGVWIFSKLMYRTGGNAKSSVIAAAISGVLLFVILLLVLNAIL